MARDKGPLGSGSPSLGLKWRMDIFPQNRQRQCLLCTKAIAYAYFTCVDVVLCMPRVKKLRNITENFAALNIRDNKNFVIFFFVIAVEYEINFTSNISRTMVY